MTDEHLPDAMPMIYAAMTFDCTVAGFVWYCDVHDSHGNADSFAEAYAVARAHETFCITNEELESMPGESCDLVVMSARTKERVSEP